MKRLWLAGLVLSLWIGQSPPASAGYRYVVYGGSPTSANGAFWNWLMGPQILPTLWPQPTITTGIPPAQRDPVPNADIQSISAKLNSLEINVGLPPWGPVVTPTPTGAPPRPTGGIPAFFPQPHQ